MRIKKGIKNIALLLGTTVAPALASVSCLNVLKILEPTAKIIKTDNVRPPAGFNFNEHKENVNEYLLNNKYRGYFLIDSSKEPKQFLKENNKYYFAKVTHEDKTISSDVYKNNNWKTDEFLPMIFIAPELKEDLFKKPGSEKFKSKLSDTYIPPVEFNNLLRNYLKGSVHLTPDEHKNFLTNMTNFLEYDSSVKRDFTIGSDKYGTFIDKFNDHYDETPYDYNKKIIKREDQFIRFNKVHGDYMELLNKDLANDPNNRIWFMPFTRSKAKAFHGRTDIYNELDEKKLWIKRGPQSYYDVLGTPNLLDQFSDPAKAYLDTQINIRAYKDYLLFLLKFQEFKNTFKTKDEINKLNEEEKEKTETEEYKKELEKFRDLLNKLTGLLTTATSRTVLGKEVERPDNQNETRVSMFPVANNELSALITKADYEHSFVWAHRALYEEVIPIHVALFGELPADLVPNNNQINIKKYITYYVNKVMKNKFQDFKEIEDNTDLNEKYNTEEYKKKAGEIYKEWLNKWKRLKENISN